MTDKRSSEDDWYSHEILAVAVGMHSAATGAADMPRSDEAERSIRWMTMRLEGWRPSYHRDAVAFDSAVRVVCELALAEFREEYNR